VVKVTSLKNLRDKSRLLEVPEEVHVKFKKYFEE
jgi:hypothetical protein